MEQEFIRIPAKGTQYFYVRACIGPCSFEVMSSKWTGSNFGFLRLAKGNFYLTEKEAQEEADFLNKRIRTILTSKR